MNGRKTPVVDARGLEDYLHAKIPLTRAMGVRVDRAGADSEEGVAGVVLVAPLEPNRNHLGTAFGGSLATLATLAGYGALWVALGDCDGHIVVKRSELAYRRPVTGALRAECSMPAGEALAAFREAYAKKGRARLRLEARIVQDGETCVEFAGEFVAIRGEEGTAGVRG